MKFIPDYVPSNYKSKAEVRIFEALHKLTGFDDWVCFHSLSISHHMTKRESEVDFLLVGPQGVFVLEVKGGRVQRHGGKWLFIDHYNHSHRGQSPFKQASSSLYSLKTQLSKIIEPHQAIRQIVFGYGVAFPDIEFKINTTEWDQAIVADKHDFSPSLGDYLRRLVKYWQTASRSSALLNHQQLKAIRQFVRGDFITDSELIDQIAESEQEIVQLTNQQLRILDMATSNDRIFLNGGAGTGKTVLAIKMFQYHAQRHQSVLFLCYNRLLVCYLQHVLKDHLGENMQIETLHNFIRGRLDISDHDIEAHPDKHKLFNQEFPDQFLTSIKQNPVKKFDYLIIDEGQDILLPQYLEVLDNLVTGGINQGQWLMSMDMNQNIYSGSNSETLKQVSSRATVLELKTNCRNTDHIISETQKITGINIQSQKVSRGVSVKHIWYQDRSDQIQKISQTINQLLKDGIEPSDITILSPFKKSFVSEGDLNVDCAVEALDENSFKSDDNRQAISYATISSYKGLENKVVILIDISDLQSEKYKMLYYVGFTRARSFLIVSINKNQKKLYAKLSQQSQSESV